jgi:Anti-sigma factor NepR
MNRKPEKPDATTMHTDVIQRRGRARLDRDTQVKIGQQLRAMYDDVVKEGVPERFAEFLRQLDERKDKDAG